MYGTKDAGSKPMLADGSSPETGAVVKGKKLSRETVEGHVCEGSFGLDSKFWTNGPSDISGGHAGNY